MTIYKVLKEFVSSDGAYIHKVDTEYRPYKSSSRTANLKKLGYIEEILDEPKTAMDLRTGDKYFYISDSGDIIKDMRAGWIIQIERRGIDNAFLTHEDVSKRLARIRAKQILIQDTKGFKPDWEDNSWKYEVHYDYITHCLVIDCSKHCVSHDSLWFATSENVRESIKNHEKEWLIYLGVEE